MRRLGKRSAQSDAAFNIACWTPIVVLFLWWTVTGFGTLLGLTLRLLPVILEFAFIFVALGLIGLAIQSIARRIAAVPVIQKIGTSIGVGLTGGICLYFVGVLCWVFVSAMIKNGPANVIAAILLLPVELGLGILCIGVGRYRA